VPCNFNCWRPNARVRRGNQHTTVSGNVASSNGVN
jgi:hypothetical protein